VIDKGLAGEQRLDRRFFGKIDHNRPQPVRRFARRADCGRSPHAFGRPSEPVLGPTPDRDERSLGQCEPGRFQADPRTTANDDHPFSVKPHGTVLLAGPLSMGKKGTGVINSRVNRADGKKELEAQRRSVQRGRPYGSELWSQQIFAPLELESSLRRRGRPRKTTREP
jgi:hypothetical protein